MNALASRALFFQGSPPLVPEPPPPDGHGVLWWFGVALLCWFIASILFGVFIWPWVAKKFFGPPEPEEERNRNEAESLRRNEVARWFKKNQRKKRGRPHDDRNS